MSGGPVKVGLIGCGRISDVYFRNLKAFPITDLVACADLIPERAQAKAVQYGCQARTVEEIVADPEIEIILNLTIPKAHAEVALKALSAGKSTYGEKPLAVSRSEGRRMLELAQTTGMRLGAAPDTFLGGGIQTCRKLIDDGWIGEPVAATAFMMCHGHESWHPDPEYYYKVGGGPMFDMGPWYGRTCQIGIFFLNQMRIDLEIASIRAARLHLLWRADGRDGLMLTTAYHPGIRVLGGCLNA